MRFLSQLEQYFLKYNIREDHYKVDFAFNRLGGDAQKWAEPYRSIYLSFGIFFERLPNKFKSSQVLARISSKLYGELQEEHEPAEVFITRKCNLFQRLVSNTPENIRSSTILNQLRPELRASLRSSYEFSTTEELVRVASKVELDIQESRNDQVYIAPHMRKSHKEKTNNSPSSPCRYCQQKHFHRDCPQNPYNSGNFERASGNRTVQQKLAQPDRQAQH
ncbi:hypothetical protein JTB14_023434 [Gonioctena quinquepunctata]|nr:hypothetical protein JTB14_023434 [Gonioctena quinquepunctata]